MYLLYPYAKGKGVLSSISFAFLLPFAYGLPSAKERQKKGKRKHRKSTLELLLLCVAFGNLPDSLAIPRDHRGIAKLSGKAKERRASPESEASGNRLRIA